MQHERIPMGMFDEAIPERYEKNPMFVVLENYVLDAIGALDPETAKKLDEVMTRTFGGKDWKTTLRDQFDLPPDTDANLQLMWKQCQEEADAQQSETSPEDFAREVVDNLETNMGE